MHRPDFRVGLWSKLRQWGGAYFIASFRLCKGLVSCESIEISNRNLPSSLPTESFPGVRGDSDCQNHPVKLYGNGHDALHIGFHLKAACRPWTEYYSHHQTPSLVACPPSESIFTSILTSLIEAESIQIIRWVTFLPIFFEEWTHCCVLDLKGNCFSPGIICLLDQSLHHTTQSFHTVQYSPFPLTDDLSRELNLVGITKDPDDMILKFCLWHFCIGIECLALLTIKNINLKSEHYKARLW